MAEWFKAQHWKCCNAETYSRVQIPISPFKGIQFKGFGLYTLLFEGFMHSASGLTSGVCSEMILAKITTLNFH